MLKQPKDIYSRLKETYIKKKISGLRILNSTKPLQYPLDSLLTVVRQRIINNASQTEIQNLIQKIEPRSIEDDFKIDSCCSALLELHLQEPNRAGPNFCKNCLDLVRKIQNTSLRGMNILKINLYL